MVRSPGRLPPKPTPAKKGPGRKPKPAPVADIQLASRRYKHVGLFGQVRRNNQFKKGNTAALKPFRQGTPGPPASPAAVVEHPLPKAPKKRHPTGGVVRTAKKKRLKYPAQLRKAVSTRSRQMCARALSASSTTHCCRHCC